jgi:hypothetical protein
MDLILIGAAISIAAAFPGMSDWFRRHPGALVAVAIILPIVWLAICAYAGFLPD